jgi:hypothetical protein
MKDENKKPKAKKVKEKKLDYHEMMDYLEKKYDFEERGFSGIPSKIKDIDRHFYRWCDDHNLPEEDTEGVNRGSSQSYYNMYKDAEDGYKLKPPYMDFWHYLCDENPELNNGSYIHIPKIANVKKLDALKMYSDMLLTTKDKKLLKLLSEVIEKEKEFQKIPDPWLGWQQQITDLIFKEFGEYEKDGYLRCWVDW